jgi:hypothetical protein
LLGAGSPYYRFEYVDAVDARQILFEVVPLATDEQWEAVAEQLERADAVFQAATKPTQEPLVAATTGGNLLRGCTPRQGTAERVRIVCIIAAKTPRPPRRACEERAEARRSNDGGRSL